MEALAKVTEADAGGCGPEPRIPDSLPRTLFCSSSKHCPTFLEECEEFGRISLTMKMLRLENKHFEGRQNKLRDKREPSVSDHDHH